METVFKLTKYTGKLVQISGDPIVAGAGFLTEAVSDMALSHISQREKIDQSIPLVLQRKKQVKN